MPGRQGYRAQPKLAFSRTVRLDLDRSSPAHDENDSSFVSRRLRWAANDGASSRRILVPTKEPRSRGPPRSCRYARTRTVPNRKRLMRSRGRARPPASQAPAAAPQCQVVVVRSIVSAAFPGGVRVLRREAPGGTRCETRRSAWRRDSIPALRRDHAGEQPRRAAKKAVTRNAVFIQAVALIRSLTAGGSGPVAELARGGFGLRFSSYLAEVCAMGHDQVFKGILRRFFRDFIELFFPKSRHPWTSTPWSSWTRSFSKGSQTECSERPTSSRAFGPGRGVPGS